MNSSHTSKVITKKKISKSAFEIQENAQNLDNQVSPNSSFSNSEKQKSENYEEIQGNYEKNEFHHSSSLYQRNDSNPMLFLNENIKRNKTRGSLKIELEENEEIIQEFNSPTQIVNLDKKEAKNPDPQNIQELPNREFENRKSATENYMLDLLSRVEKKAEKMEEESIKNPQKLDNEIIVHEFLEEIYYKISQNKEYSIEDIKIVKNYLDDVYERITKKNQESAISFLNSMYSKSLEKYHIILKENKNYKFIENIEKNKEILIVENQNIIKNYLNNLYMEISKKDEEKLKNLSSSVSFLSQLYTKSIEKYESGMKKSQNLPLDKPQDAIKHESTHDNIQFIQNYLNEIYIKTAKKYNPVPIIQISKPQTQKKSTKLLKPKEKANLNKTAPIPILQKNTNIAKDSEICEKYLTNLYVNSIIKQNIKKIKENLIFNYNLCEISIDGIKNLENIEEMPIISNESSFNNIISSIVPNKASDKIMKKSEKIKEISIQKVSEIQILPEQKIPTAAHAQFSNEFLQKFDNLSEKFSTFQESANLIKILENTQSELDTKMLEIKNLITLSNMPNKAMLTCLTEISEKMKKMNSKIKLITEDNSNKYAIQLLEQNNVFFNKLL